MSLSSTLPQVPLTLPFFSFAFSLLHDHDFKRVRQVLGWEKTIIFHCHGSASCIHRPTNRLIRFFAYWIIYLMRNTSFCILNYIYNIFFVLLYRAKYTVVKISGFAIDLISGLSWPFIDLKVCEHISRWV